MSKVGGKPLIWGGYQVIAPTHPPLPRGLGKADGKAGGRHSLKSGEATLKTQVRHCCT